MAICTHIAESKETAPRANGCEECLKTGGRWVHLRTCQECGHVGCCDSSPGKHASGHFHDEKHPVVQSAEPGESWKWCFVDEVLAP
ncbi:UBP-type zinc finger domain-containing protein [Cryptosporangium japonicum]|uniref:UBP-type zinc finger domain-containing protein n=1 Tax=Cryptosporangium japonicum TaxID=80872 RepID=A0ABP3EIT9_9ACTN